MSPRARLMTLLTVGIAMVAAVVIALSVIPDRPEEAARPDPVAATVPVALNADGVPAKFSLGVILTFGSSGEPGSEYNRAVQGAVVAAQRFSKGGTEVTLSARNDSGTEDGAREAVRSLAEQGVSGVVVSTTGAQARAAAKAAEELGLPVILPYAEPSEPADSTWTTSPSATALDAALGAALEGKIRLLVVNDGGSVPSAAEGAQTLNLQDFEDITALAQAAAIRTGDQPLPPAEGASAGAESVRVSDPADAVIVSAATPHRLARLVQSLQSRDVSVPMVLSREATAPAFATELSVVDGAVSGQLMSVAAVNGDGAALQQDAQGRGMSAFLSAVRMFSGDPQIKNLTGDVAFSADAWAADAAGHDAVVALVRAAAVAESSLPRDVSEALSTMTLGAGDGLAGPALDFTAAAALTAKPVPVHASSQDLGLRPTDGSAPRLVWVPAATSP